MVVTPIVGNHVYLGGFDQETVDSVTVDKDNPPDESPESNWRSMGCIAICRFQHSFEGENRNYCPSPGTYVHSGNTYQSTSTRLEIELKDLTADAWQLILGISSLDGSFVGTPGSQGQPKKGWLKVQQYESGTEDNLVNIEAWCQLMFSSPTTFSQQQTQAVLTAEILDNALNSVQLLNDAQTGA